jgi:peptidoglycan-associated lipoprotein
MMPMRQRYVPACLALALLVGAGCTRRVPPATPQPQPPDVQSGATAPARPMTPPPPPQAVEDAIPRDQPLAVEDSVAGRSLDDLNRNSPLRPVFFALDSADLDDAGRRVASANADVLKQYSSWVVTIEGHCDDRGTSEYNLALGERRAVAVRTYLESLGIPASRLRTVTYGEEFPFDASATDEAWAQNRRAHFVITAK